MTGKRKAELAFTPKSLVMSIDSMTADITITLQYGSRAEAAIAYDAAAPDFRRFCRSDGLLIFVRPTD